MLKLTEELFKIKTDLVLFVVDTQYFKFQKTATVLKTSDFEMAKKDF